MSNCPWTVTDPRGGKHDVRRMRLSVGGRDLRIGPARKVPGHTPSADECSWSRARRLLKSGKATLHMEVPGVGDITFGPEFFQVPGASAQPWDDAFDKDMKPAWMFPDSTRGLFLEGYAVGAQSLRDNEILSDSILLSTLARIKGSAGENIAHAQSVARLAAARYLAGSAVLGAGRTPSTFIRRADGSVAKRRGPSQELVEKIVERLVPGRGNTQGELAPRGGAGHKEGYVLTGDGDEVAAIAALKSAVLAEKSLARSHDERSDAEIHLAGLYPGARIFENPKSFAVIMLGKYEPKITFLVPKPVLPDYSQPIWWEKVSHSPEARQMILDMNLGFDPYYVNSDTCGIQMIFGRFFTSRAGKPHFEAGPPGTSPHVMLSAPWSSGGGKSMRGLVRDSSGDAVRLKAGMNVDGTAARKVEDSGVTWFRTSRSNGGGAGVDYYVLPAGFRHGSDPAEEQERSLAVSRMLAARQAEMEERVSALRSSLGNTETYSIRTLENEIILEKTVEAGFALQKCEVELDSFNFTKDGVARLEARVARILARLKRTRTPDAPS